MLVSPSGKRQIVSALSRFSKKWAAAQGSRPGGSVPVPTQVPRAKSGPDDREVVSDQNIAESACCDSLGTSLVTSTTPLAKGDIELQVSDLPHGAPNIGHVERRPEASLLPSTAVWVLPSVAVDAGRAADYWLAAASLAGRGHSVHGHTRQDSYAFALAEDGEALIVAVADGLGSRSFSHIGAQHVARAICTYLGQQSLPRTKEAAESAVRHVVTEAQYELLRVWAPAYRVEDPRLMATTVAAAWIPVDPALAQSIVFRVGDANAFTATNSPDEPFGSIFGSDDGPINLVTASIPERNPAEVVQIAHVGLDGVSKIVLCTDGFADDIYESPGVRKWLAKRWITPCTGRWMLDALSYARSGSHDDRTAAVIWLDPSGVRAGTTERQINDDGAAAEGDGE
jgi:serine/threonine protein phosphatase PrpC